MKAREIMTPNPDVVTADEPLSHVAEIMRDRNIGIVPVVSDRQSMRVEGLITDRDIVIRHVAQAHQHDCRARDHMTAGRLDTVRPDSDLDEVMELMKRDQVRRVLVTDANGQLLGVIAQADIAVKDTPEPPARVAEVLEKISEPAQPSR